MEYLKNKTILIVEDDEVLRESLIMEFEFQGARVLSADSGDAGFEIVKSGEKIDAILSDVRMPNGNGAELLKKVKALNVEFPVMMFMTGYTDLSLPEAYDLGAEAILPKPFDLDELHALMKRIMTPKTIRWEPPCEVVKEHLQWHFSSLNEASQSHQFFLGRGGFFVPDENPVKEVKKNEKVNFTVTFSSGKFREISGCGIIRYIDEFTKSEGHKKGYGIEFDHLPEDISEELWKFLIDHKVKAFIPMRETSI